MRISISPRSILLFLPSVISSSTHSCPSMTPSRPSVMCVPRRSPLPVPPGRLYLTRKLPSPLESFWQNGILANALSPPLTTFLGVRFGAARRESRDPKSQPGSLPVLDRWTQAKAWDLRVLISTEPHPSGSVQTISRASSRLSTLVGWWFSMVICSVSPFLVSCLCSRFSLSGYHEVYTKHSIDKTVCFLLVSSKCKVSF